MNKQEKDPKKLIEEITFGKNMAETKTFAKVDDLILGTSPGFTEDEIIRFARPDSVLTMCPPTFLISLISC